MHPKIHGTVFFLIEFYVSKERSERHKSIFKSQDKIYYAVMTCKVPITILSHLQVIAKKLIYPVKFKGIQKEVDVKNHRSLQNTVYFIQFHSKKAIFQNGMCRNTL